MGFQVKYEEITSIRELILAQLDRWIEQIDAVRSSIVEIAAMSEMHGEAAEHVRSYMWDYHMNLAKYDKRYDRNLPEQLYTLHRLVL